MHKLASGLTSLFGILLLPLAAFAADPVDPLRLTRDVVPVAESVELTLDPAKDDYSGRAHIDLLASGEFSNFRLHAEGPAISSATLKGESIPDGVTLRSEVVDVSQGLVKLTNPAPLPAGNYRLTLEFTAKFQRDGLGLYKTVSRGDPYLFTQFEDRHARKAFPCWDEPSFKIPYQLTLTVPAALEAVTNAAVAYETRNGDQKTIAFTRMPPMPSYLVAMAIGPLEFVPIPGLGVPGRIITPKGQAALAAAAVDFAPPLLADLEDYFGIRYPYGKLDQIAVPEYVYGAMENAGLITYTDRLLLMDPEKPSFALRRRLASVMAHEMAHMWFGDLVTMSWWDDLWLNESFADWICARVVEHRYPNFRIQIQESREIKKAMLSDALPSITAIRRKVTATTDLAQLADELTYNKGKGILTMVENWIGPEQFRSAMRAYFTKHSWGNTVADDLWDAFSHTSGDDITGMLAGFIEQPGVPLLSFALEPGGQLRVSQRRFNNLGDPQLPGQWQVPIVLNWASADGKIHRERLLLRDKEQVFSIAGLENAEWVYPNADESGYYRWMLSPDLNARLARRSGTLATIERVGLIDNSSALFNAGLIDATAYLAYLTAFNGDADPDVNASVITSSAGLDEMFITPETRDAYLSYRRAILKPVLDRIGLQAKAGESEHYGPLRNSLFLALGFEAKDPAVIAEARRLADQFFANPMQVDASLRGTALAIAAYHGDAALFAKMKEALAQAQNPLVRSALIVGLGRFHDPALATEALNLALTPALNSTEFISIITKDAGGVAADREMRAQTVDWIMAHFDAIAAKAPPEYLVRLVAVPGASDPALFERFRQFLLSSPHKTEYLEVTLAKASDRQKVVIRLREKERANVEKFLKSFPGKTPID